MKLIGLSGKKLSGKDTAAAVMLAGYGSNNAVKLAFADELKREVARACNVTVEYVEQSKQLFRPILQWWGTDFRRNTNHPDYWCNIMHKKLKYLVNQFDAIIISDVRFKNEFDMIKEQGGYVFRVLRPSTDCAVDYHPSEIDLDGAMFDGIIGNEGTLRDLQVSVLKTLTTHSLI